MKEDEFKNHLNELVKKRSLNSLLLERDKYQIGSEKWNIYNILKASKLELNNPRYDENILVILDEFTKHLDSYTNYNKNDYYNLEKQSFPMRRSFAEYDCRYRQLVANALIRCGNEYMFLERKNKYTESRLGEGSLGLPGGHVNALDENILIGLLRELGEELNYFDAIDSLIEPIAIIREEYSGKKIVSNEHVCCLFRCTTKFNNIRSKTKSEVVAWYSKETILNILKSNPTKFDTWTHLAVVNEFGLELENNVAG